MEPNTNPPPPNSSQGISNGSNQPINLIPYPKSNFFLKFHFIFFSYLKSK